MPANYDIECGDIFSKPAACIVSPANSFGFMDGGVDLVLTKRFGWSIQDAVQRRIRDDFGGELLVGQALTVETDDDEFPILISAPTMRVNMRILDPQAVRLAARAAMREAVRIGADSIVSPGMGTGCGAVKPGWAAQLMAAGFADALGPKMFPKSLHVAHEDHHRPYPKA